MQSPATAANSTPLVAVLLKLLLLQVVPFDWLLATELDATELALLELIAFELEVDVLFEVLELELELEEEELEAVDPLINP
jgi:hypothetical protein